MRNEASAAEGRTCLFILVSDEILPAHYHPSRRAIIIMCLAMLQGTPCNHGDKGIESHIMLNVTRSGKMNHSLSH